MFRDHGQAMHARFVEGGRERGRGRGTQLFGVFFRPNADDGFDVCHVRDKFTQHEIVMPKGLELMSVRRLQR